MRPAKSGNLIQRSKKESAPVLGQSNSDDRIFAMNTKSFFLQPPLDLQGAGSGIENLFKNGFPKSVLTIAQQQTINLSLASLLNKAINHHRMGQLEQAEEFYIQILKMNPRHPDALHLLGVIAHQFGKNEIALELLDKAIQVAPNSATIYSNRGVVLKALRLYPQALKSFDRAILLHPNDADAYRNRGNVLLQIKRYPEASKSYDKALSIKPDFEFIDGARLFAKASIFDWENFEEQREWMEKQINLGRKVANPFFTLALCESAAMQQKAAEIYTRSECPMRATTSQIARHSKRDRIRIGYFSPDFREHAVSYLMAEIFERHDKNRFEVFGFSYGPNTSDAMQKRIAAAMEHYVDVRPMSDAQIARYCREMEIDIAVDLAGHTFGGRIGIFAERAAPIQVNYLGHPGTVGAEYIDYILADRTLIPEQSRKFYTEKIAYLPDCYQANDSQAPISDKVFSRVKEGLPKTGFIYCCFNGSYKIMPQTFDRWMRILQRVEGSVLWVVEENPSAVANLRREAQKRGVRPERIVFGKRLPSAEHLSRQRLADLFLDTFPFNAGATASSALWAGLPVLTCMGEAFAGRMAASLLSALHMPELIANSQEDYEELAVKLATTPGLIQQIKERLQQNRLAAPLFDIPKFTSSLEAAYAGMYERYSAELSPDHIFIAPK
jgi:predicted O-linked N-acetylglucosamine transferase (SPINDLY family)